MKMLGVVFPGQGSQQVGMLAEIANNFPIVKETYQEASDVLEYDLWKLVQEGPAEVLNQTVHTQPAVLTASYALWRALGTLSSFQPALLAGHSLGEYTALVCAQAISFKEAVHLVAARGLYMQEAVAPGKGALAAIVGLSPEAIHDICLQVVFGEEVLSSANYNSPEQVVIGGHIAAVERALVLANEAGAKFAKLLPVSVPSHTTLMKPAAQRLQRLLADIDIRIPTYPVISNVDVKIYQDATDIRDGLTRQLFMPVRWVETIQAFAKAEITHIIECGPGRILTGLIRRIEPQIQLTNIGDLASLQSLLRS